MCVTQDLIADEHLEGDEEEDEDEDEDNGEGDEGPRAPPHPSQPLLIGSCSGFMETTVKIKQNDMLPGPKVGLCVSVSECACLYVCVCRYMCL